MGQGWREEECGDGAMVERGECGRRMGVERGGVWGVDGNGAVVEREGVWRVDGNGAVVERGGVWVSVWWGDDQCLQNIVFSS